MKVLVFILFIGGLGQYLPVKNKMNMAYFVPVGIGTPGQQVQLLVSSFSSVEVISLFMSLLLDSMAAETIKSLTTQSQKLFICKQRVSIKM